MLLTYFRQHGQTGFREDPSGNLSTLPRQFVVMFSLNAFQQPDIVGIVRENGDTFVGVFDDLRLPA